MKGWSIIACDEVDVAGEMAELRCGELKILVPYSAMLTAVAAQSGHFTLENGPRGETDSRAISRADDNSGCA
ncbi:hypothetical protein SB861_55230 [Paraburkholderia sp. SIMBA_049]